MFHCHRLEPRRLTSRRDAKATATRKDAKLILRISYLPLILVGLFITGCDPVRTIQQAIVIDVGPAESLSTLTSPNIRIREHWSRTGENERFHEFNPERSAASPWFAAKLEDDGFATVVVVNTAIDSARGQTPPAGRDAITGREFICEIRDGDEVIRTARMTMREGYVATDDSFVIRVESIGEPSYVE